MIQCRQILSTNQEEWNNGMKAYLKELVAKARLLTMESDHVEFVFDDPIPRGTYFIAVYTRHGKDTGYGPQPASAAR